LRRLRQPPPRPQLRRQPLTLAGRHVRCGYSFSQCSPQTLPQALSRGVYSTDFNTARDYQALLQGWQRFSSRFVHKMPYFQILISPAILVGPKQDVTGGEIRMAIN
jgi:hypothetical protein